MIEKVLYLKIEMRVEKVNKFRVRRVMEFE